MENKEPKVFASGSFCYLVVAVLSAVQLLKEQVGCYAIDWLL
jgi:hypothetical protein